MCFKNLFKNKKKKKEEAQVEKKPVQTEQPKKESIVASVSVPKKEEPKPEPKKVETNEVKKEAPVQTTTQAPTKEAPKPAPKAEEKPAPKEEPKQETSTRPGKYEVFSVGDMYLYRLKASNGEVLVTSELYTALKGAKDAIETVKKNVETGNFTIYKDKHNLFQFKLYAVNKRLLAVSANYNSKDRAQSAIESFKKFALNSTIEVLEEDPQHLMEEIKIEKQDNKEGGKILFDEDGFDGENEVEFRLVASNGKVLCSSMSYKTKDSLLQQIDSFKEAVTQGKFYVVQDKNGKFQFKLYAKSGRCLVVGESYDSKTNAISAANSVSAFATLAKVN